MSPWKAAQKKPLLSIDEKTRTIKISFDPENPWNIEFSGSADLKLNLKSLEVNTEENISLMAGDGKKYILLNTTEEQYREWLEEEKERKKFAELGEVEYARRILQMYANKGRIPKDYLSQLQIGCSHKE